MSTAWSTPAVGIAGALTARSGGILTVGQLTSFLSYANQYTKPFNEISGVVTELQNALASAARVFELIDEEPSPGGSQDAVKLQNVTGQVDLEQVNFSYDPGSEADRGLEPLGEARPADRHRGPHRLR